MADVQYHNGSNWVSLDYRDFKIRNGNGENIIASRAKIWLNRNAPITANDKVRVRFDGTTRFEGLAKSSGKYDSKGNKIYNIRGYGYEIMEEEVSVNLSSTTASNILSDAISSTNYSINAPSSSISVPEYDVTRRRRNIFKDMLSRTDYIIRVTPDKVIHFESKSYRGNYGTFDAQNSKTVIVNWEEDDLDTVINSVTVVGTKNNRRVEGTASNSSSVTNYGERSRRYNFKYISGSAEADSMASSLLRPNPKDNGKLRASGNLFDSSNIVNYNIDVIDSSRSISSTVIIKEQIIRDGYISLRVGRGVDFGLDEYNRGQSSAEDKTGSGKEWSDVYDDGSKPDPNADVTVDHTDDINHVGTSAPSNPQKGWFWYDTSNGNLKRYNGSSWVIQADITGQNKQDFTWLIDNGDKPDPNADVTKYHTDDINHISSSAPSSPKSGWIWLDTSTNPDTLKRYNGSSWDTIGTVEASWSGIYDDNGNKPDPNADVTADNSQDYSWVTGTKPDAGATENDVYTQDSSPSGSDGDIWIDTDNYKVYVHNGSSWTLGGDITSDHQSDIDLSNLGTKNHSNLDSVSAGDHHSKTDTFTELTGDIEKTQIGDDTVITRMVASDQIVASHINSDEITANEIDTLDLDTNMFSVGSDQTYQINFGEFQTSGETAAIPESDEECYIGTDSTAFHGIYSRDVHTDNLFALDMNYIQATDKIRGEIELDYSSTIGENDTTDFLIFDLDASNNHIEMTPSSDNTCQIGSSSVSYLSMWSYNFNTASPQKFEGNPLDGVKDYEVSKGKKNLPEYVKARDENGETVDEGMNIGAMTSWLLEQNKAQQKRIESLEDKVSKLDKRLDKLENEDEKRN